MIPGGENRPSEPALLSSLEHVHVLVLLLVLVLVIVFVLVLVLVFVLVLVLVIFFRHRKPGHALRVKSLFVVCP